MILIDAININSGGGVTLLEQLVCQLEKVHLKHFILLDNRYSKSGAIKNNYKKYKSNIIKRSSIIEESIRVFNPNILICFGNFPPPKKFKNIKIITYFQNCLLIPSLWGNWMNLKEKSLLLLKSTYLKLYLNNSDYFVFQTHFVANKFNEFYKPQKAILEVFPFFNEDVFVEKISDIKIRENNSFIYVSSGSAHKNHINLFAAWAILGDRGLFPKLIVTLQNSLYDEQINLLKSRGCDIINLGNVNSTSVVELNLKSEFTIFPSYVETIGLGIVEGVFCGTKIISSNLPFLEDIVEPTLSFDPSDANDIATKVEFAMKNKDKLKDSKLVIKNQINDFINFLQMEL